MKTRPTPPSKKTPEPVLTLERDKEYMAEAARATRARKWLYTRQQAGVPIAKSAPQWAAAGITPGSKLKGEYVGDRLYITV